MFEILIVLAPMMLVALGGLVVLASEAFVADDRKHLVLPWTGTVFLIIAALVQCCIAPNDLVAVGSLYATDPVRAWLNLAVIGSAAAGLAGLQSSLRRDSFPGGEPYALSMLAAAGVMLMVSASHYLGLFVGLELASIAIYATVGTRRDRVDSGEGLLKYLIMGAVFSAIFLYGVALTYGATGGFAYGLTPLEGREQLMLLGQVLIMLGLLFKVGAVPFHFWSPDAYTGAPIAVTGFMAAVMKIGGFVALGTIWLALVGGQYHDGVVGLHEAVQIDPTMIQPLGTLQKVLLGIAVVSLLVGNFSALQQSHLRRLMAFSSVSHAGYMLLAFGLPHAVADNGTTTFALGGLWYYLVGYGLATSAALAVLAGLCGRDDNDEIAGLAGAGRRHVIAGVLLTVLVASLAGLPPTAGFLGKYLIFGDLIQKAQLELAIIGIVIAVVGAAYYVRFIIDLWSGSGDATAERRVGGLAFGVGVLAAAAVIALLALPDLGAEAARTVAELAGP